MITCRRALLLAAATTVATATAVAQTRPPHRIEITRSPARARIPRTAAEPRIRAGAMGVVDWMGQSEAASTLSGGRAPVTILADDVTFKGGTSVLRGTPRLTIVARTASDHRTRDVELFGQGPGRFRRCSQYPRRRRAVRSRRTADHHQQRRQQHVAGRARHERRHAHHRGRYLWNREPCCGGVSGRGETVCGTSISGRRPTGLECATPWRTVDDAAERRMHRVLECWRPRYWPHCHVHRSRRP